MRFDDPRVDDLIDLILEVADLLGAFVLDRHEANPQRRPGDRLGSAGADRRSLAAAARRCVPADCRPPRRPSGLKVSDPAAWLPTICGSPGCTTLAYCLPRQPLRIRTPKPTKPARISCRLFIGIPSAPHIAAGTTDSLSRAAFQTFRIGCKRCANLSRFCRLARLAHRARNVCASIRSRDSLAPIPHVDSPLAGP